VPPSDVMPRKQRELETITGRGYQTPSRVRGRLHPRQRHGQIGSMRRNY
jgi:hypothetical protein